MDELRLRIWQGTGELTLYEDDGRTFDYKSGAFCTTLIRVYREGEEAIAKIAPRRGNWTPTQREIVVELVGVGEQRFTDDGTTQQLRF